MSERHFKPGTVVVFEPGQLNPDFWNRLTQAEKDRCYGSLVGKCFIFLCEVNDSGHCVLLGFDGQFEIMRHISDFREATEAEW